MYANISWSDKFLVSSTMADILLTLFASTTCLNSSTALSVLSSLVVPSNVTIIILVSLSYSLSVTSSGSISFGILTPTTSLILNTLLTPSIFFIFFSSCNTL